MFIERIVMTRENSVAQIDAKIKKFSSIFDELEKNIAEKTNFKLFPEAEKVAENLMMKLRRAWRCRKASRIIPWPLR